MPSITTTNPPTPSPSPGWRLESTYATLPTLFHAPAQPTPVPAPRTLILNRPLAQRLGLDPDALDTPQAAAIFAGNALPPGPHPLAQAYAGHPFGHLAALGDGRAILLGEQFAPDGARFDIQLKGPGPTPYSRRGDGRAALGPMLREYIVSEAMHALRIPTTRSLAVAATGDTVFRETPLPGAVLVRVAASHLRVGTVQWAAAHEDLPALRAIAHYTIHRHYPQHAQDSSPYLPLLHSIIERQAALLAQWQLVGFVHGVMNTDNMALSGETIDYGPCAFIDAYDPASVYSAIDRHGRYAYDQQPTIARWNLARLAEALLPLLHPDDPQAALDHANAALDTFQTSYQRHWLEGMRAKLGLLQPQPDDPQLAQSLLDWMAHTRADYTNTFATLSAPASQATPPFPHPEFHAWHARWTARLAHQPQPPADTAAHMRAHNPALIPRNHQVERALAAAHQNDLAPTHALLAALAHPYDHSHPPSPYTNPPPPNSPPYQTHCGT